MGLRLLCCYALRCIRIRRFRKGPNVRLLSASGLKKAA